MRVVALLCGLLGVSSSRIAKPTSTTTRALDFLARVRANDCGAAAAVSARRFVVGGTVLGRVLPRAADALSRFPEAFDVDGSAVVLRDDPGWASLGAADVVEARSQRVGAVLQSLRRTGEVPMLDGWRDEPFAVRPSFYAPPLVIVERAAGPLFGLAAFGCFANGFVCADEAWPTRPTHLWVGRRSRTKPTWPGLLDVCAAGGIAAGQSVSSAMRAECAEEAGVPPELMGALLPTGGVSYTGFNEDGWGVKSDILFTFDLPLPRSFAPTPVDGEVEAFVLMPIAQVAELLASPEPHFKPNVGVVMVDFLIRHGFVNPDEDGYIELMGALRSGVRLDGSARFGLP